MKKAQDQIWADLAALLLLIGGIGTGALTVQAFRHARSVASWPTAEGIVLHSELQDRIVGIHREYEADILYRYVVAGETFEATSVRTRGTATRRRWDAAAAVDRFSAGSAVQVYYDPDDPGHSYLEAGVDRISYAIVVFPILFALASACHIVARIRRIPELSSSRSIDRWMAPAGGGALGGLMALGNGQCNHLPCALGLMTGLAAVGALSGILVALAEVSNRSTDAPEDDGMPGTLFGRIFALLSLFLCWAPVFGAMLGGIAAFLNRRAGGWPKKLSYGIVVVTLPLNLALGFAARMYVGV